MNVSCPSCDTVYRIDPAKVPEAGVQARCTVCSHVIAVSREEETAPAVETVPQPVAPEAVAPAVAPEPREPAHSNEEIAHGAGDGAGAFGASAETLPCD